MQPVEAFRGTHLRVRTANAYIQRYAQHATLTAPLHLGVIPRESDCGPKSALVCSAVHWMRTLFSFPGATQIRRTHQRDDAGLGLSMWTTLLPPCSRACNAASFTALSLSIPSSAIA